jgi:hypothetical protein
VAVPATTGALAGGTAPADPAAVSAGPAPVTHGPGPTGQPTAADSGEIIATDEVQLRAAVGRIEAVLREHPGRTVRITWVVE